MPEHLIGRQLMESASRTNRSVRPLMVSIAVHAAAVAFSVWATLETKPDAPAILAERVGAVNVSAFHFTPTPTRQPTSNAQQGFQVLEAPHEVPTALTLASLKAPSTIPENFTGRGPANGKAAGIVVAPAVMVARGDEPIEGAFADQLPYMLPAKWGQRIRPCFAIGRLTVSLWFAS